MMQILNNLLDVMCWTEQKDDNYYEQVSANDISTDF